MGAATKTRPLATPADAEAVVAWRMWVLAYPSNTVESSRLEPIARGHAGSTLFFDALQPSSRMPPMDAGELLRRHGLRVTVQRLAVMRAVSERPHVTADMVAESWLPIRTWISRWWRQRSPHLSLTRPFAPSFRSCTRSLAEHSDSGLAMRIG